MHLWQWNESFVVVPGGSLGPEAALLALCGSTTSWLARKVFGARGQMLRNCALMGMTAGLAAFFGVALGGLLTVCALAARIAPCKSSIEVSMYI